MCGLLGAVVPRSAWSDTLRWVSGAAAALAHRGPDDSGLWTDESAGILLAHRRLSIVDLSSAGHQPMQAASGRWVVSYNGEIYNHLELRAALGDLAWRGHSDTETLLAGFDRWGVRSTIERCVGMFAIAVWDRRQQEISLIRDRFGEKPLYYGWQGHAFLFASELKAMRSHPSFLADIDRDSIAQYMAHGMIMSPRSIYRGICKLAPGSIVTLGAGRDGIPVKKVDAVLYWNLEGVVSESAASRVSADTRGSIDELEGILKRAILGQMMADVPLGAFLSGGLDSSTVVALMQAQSSRPVQTFTVGFGEDGYNEAQHASEVARYLGTNHTELVVTPDQAMDVIQLLPQMYDEPFGDSSQIPTFLIAQLARQKVSVALSGDAGDEIFGGYNRYFLAAGMWPRIAAIPRSCRRLVARGLRSVSPTQWDDVYQLASPLLPPRMRLRLPGDKIHKIAGVLAAGSGRELYDGLTQQRELLDVVRGREGQVSAFGAWAGLDSLPEQMMAWDAVTYLPDDILVKVDRAAMAVSLETRVPFLDHRVVEFAWKLPLSMKLRDGRGKWALRQILARYVPKSLTERPKMGFGVPIDTWLRGALRPWAESLLSRQRLDADGFLNTEIVRRLWAEHLSQRANRQHALWTVLMFQAWLEHERR